MGGQSLDAQDGSDPQYRLLESENDDATWGELTEEQPKRGAN